MQPPPGLEHTGHQELQHDSLSRVALGRTSLAHAHSYQPACHDCWPCQALGSPTAPAEHNDTMPKPDPQFTLTPGSP